MKFWNGESSLSDIYRKAFAFWQKYASRELVKRIRAEFALRSQQAVARGQPSALAQATASFIMPKGPSPSVAQMSNKRFEALTPLATYLAPPSPHNRINIVTDSIGSGSLFGGVGTALIFATLLANKLGANLRIITRTERPQAENVDHILSVYGLALQGEIQFKFLPPYDHRESIDFSETESFITTSWWTTSATLASVPASSIIYLLQEDERMFYPFGDDRLKCEAILRNSDIQFVINTQLLFDHFVSEGFINIAQHGYWFEPSFPTQVFHPRPIQNKSKYKFFFYARPNNLRNLFYLGLEVIDAAIAQQILDPAEWEIILVGKDIPDIVFEGDLAPTKHENMSWSEYADLVGSIDLGLSLMYTPHPSYPPLDLVASGAVVVTNRFSNKQSLDQYSANLICVNADREALLCAMREGVALAKDKGRREQNLQNNGLGTDWRLSFADIIERLAGNI